jgi:hypothetical protein
MEYSLLWKRESDEARKKFDIVCTEFEQMLDELDLEDIELKEDADLTPTINYLICLREQVDRPVK